MLHWLVKYNHPFLCTVPHKPGTPIQELSYLYSKRMRVHDALEHEWLKQDHSEYDKRIAGSRYMGVRTRIHNKYVSRLTNLGMTERGQISFQEETCVKSVFFLLVNKKLMFHHY